MVNDDIIFPTCWVNRYNIFGVADGFIFCFLIGVLLWFNRRGCLSSGKLEEQKIHHNKNETFVSFNEMISENKKVAKINFSQTLSACHSSSP